MASPISYVSTNDVQKKWVLLLIKEFVENLKQMSGKCMDLGCGPGDITRNLLLPSLHPDATVIGTDISEAMIEYAKKTYVDDKRISFDILNMETKDLPEKYVSEFDHLFSFQAIHWCNDIRQVFKNINRMLRPGGTLIITVLAFYDSMEECFKFLQKDVRSTPYMRPNRNYVSPFYNSTQPCEDMKELLEDIGFTIHHCRLEEMMLTVKDIETAVFSAYSLLLKMPNDGKEEFQKEVLRVYEEARIKFRGNDPRFPSDYKRDQTTIIDLHKVLIVYAQKTV